MIFDTYHDRQNGFIFGTNVTGIEYDAQVRNEGESLRTGPPGGLGGGNSGGSGAGVNVNWDASWEVKTQLTATGWNAEFAIPLRTLRYGPPPQVWGINFTRNIQHKREQVYWSPISRIYTLSRLSSAGELRDLNVPAPRDLKLMPYTIGSVNRNYSRTDRGRSPRRLGHRRQDRRDVEHDARPHLQHRLRAGGGRRAADQPDAVQSPVSREAAVLPRESRAVCRRQERRGRSLLQPPHRHRRQRRVRAHSRWRPADGQHQRDQRRRAEHADRARGPDAREQLLGGAPQQGLAQPVEPRRDFRQPHRDRRDRRTRQLESFLRPGWAAGDRRGSHRQRLRGEDADTRTVRQRSRLQLGIRIPPPRIQLELQLHGSRRRLQPGGRVPGTPRRLPAVDRRLFSECP